MWQALKVSTVLVALAGGFQAGMPGAFASSGGYLTAYVGWGKPSALAAASAAMGHHFTYASDYISDSSWTSLDDIYDERPWQGTPYTMIWGVPMLPESGGSLAAGAAGDYDHYFKVLAENLVSNGQANSVLRLGWEFNSRSFPWYAAGQAKSFVAYWRQIVTTMQTVRREKFRFEWDANIGDNGHGDVTMGKLKQYYPGGAYVDIIGLDVYDQAWNTYPGATAEFSSIEHRAWGLDWLASFAKDQRKPIAIPEFGLGVGGHAATPGGVFHDRGPVSGGEDATFITDMSVWVAAHPVVAIVYWDRGHWAVQQGQHSPVLEALQDGFRG